MKLRALCQRGLALLALTALLGGAGLVPQATQAQESPTEARGAVESIGRLYSLAVGAGRTTLTADLFPDEYVGDTVRVALFSYARSGQPASGDFTIVHTQPDGDLVAELRGTVECMRIEGDFAVVAGRITYVDFPGVPEGGPPVGGVAGIVVEDGGPGGDTMLWSFGGADEELNCDEIPAQTAVPVEQGDFVVTG